MNESKEPLAAGQALVANAPSVSAVPQEAGSRPRPILFLDIDDVLVIDTAYGGYDVAQARLAAGEGDIDWSADFWDTLFDPLACSLLARLDQTFRPLYVLTTSWWWILDDETLRQVLERVGLGFVVENLHEDCATPKGPKPDLRWNEICAWLGAHPEAKDDWVVLDDYLSGTGLVRAHPPDSREIAP